MLADRPEFAETIWTRLRGLLGRDGLAEGEALYLAPCPQVHMFFMRFAIDVVFVDRGHVVVAVVEELAPWKISAFHGGAHAAIELPAGTLAAKPVAVGDQLEVTRPGEVGPG